MAARGTGAMHVAKIVRPYKERVYVYHFVRQTYREDGRVKHRTLANLSHLPPAVIELVRRALAGDPLALEAADGPLQGRPRPPHGHGAARPGTGRVAGARGGDGRGPDLRSRLEARDRRTPRRLDPRRAARGDRREPRRAGHGTRPGPWTPTPGPRP